MGRTMGFIFYKFTIAGIISIACTIIAVLIVLDCCRIRYKLTRRLEK